jgi:serine protease Do
MEHWSRQGTDGMAMKRVVGWAIAITLIVVMCAPGLQAQSRGEARSELRNLSNAFTQVAQDAMPAVVFIQVEKTLQGGESSSNLNNPFDLFGEEFFERFFGQRFPRQQREHPQPHQYRQQGQGSGFIVSKDGYILTNHHVVGEADKITVTLADNREFKAKLVGTDAKADVAVIKIDGTDFPVLPQGNSDMLAVGEWVIAIGNPFGLTHTMTVGVVSAKGRSRMGITDYEDFIQTDAAINPGNSGGPLLDLDGQVVGINTAIFSQSDGYMGIGFAIPINMATAIQKQLIATGKVSRGYLGVSIQDLTPELAKSFGLSGIEGVLVAGVSPDTPAATAGFKTGDVIVAFGETAVTETGHLRNLVAQTPVGQHVSVRIIRDKKSQEMAVTIGELPDKVAAATTTPNEPEALEKWGFAAQDLTAELANQLGYSEKQGVVVTDVQPGSPADEAGLQPGTLIREVNRQAVRDTEELMQLLARAKAAKQVLLLVQDRQGTRFLTLALA